MGISFQEFSTAMETYQAIRILGQKGSRWNIPVPCFNVAGIDFLHSGSYYIVQRGGKVPKEIMNRAMAEFGEKYPGGDNFWYGEIHSVRGILTLVSMLESKYTKELVDQLTNETYRKLLSSPLIKGNAKLPFKKASISQKWKEFYKLVLEHDRIANPFCKNTDLLKNPSEYLDKVNISVTFDKSSDIAISGRIELKTKNIEVQYGDNEEGWYYYTDRCNDTEECEEIDDTFIGHYYNNGVNNQPIDEVVYLDYRTGKGYKKHPKDVDLRISLMTGLAWETFKEEEAKPVTDKQLEVMILHLKRNIERAKSIILDEMVKK